MRLFASCFIALLLFACGSKPDSETLTSEQQAMEACRNYYEALYDGHYEKFLNGRVNADEMPERFRQAMTNNLKQHVAKTRQEHRGVERIDEKSAKRDTSLHVMMVYLLVNYGDTTKEEIVVPMVESDGDWKMK